MKNKINFDGILSFFILAACIWADYVVFTATSLPTAWRYIIIAIVTIITLLLFVLTFKRMPNWGVWIRRVFTLLFIIIFVFSSVNLDKFRIFTTRVTDVKDENLESISVVVKADSKINDLEDLSKKTIFYQNGTDEENAKYVMDELKNDVKNVSFESENNYFTLAQLLLDGEIDALIISNPYIRSIEDGLEGFEAGIKIVKTYQRPVDRLDKDHTGADLDLTQDVFTVMVSGMDETGDPNVNSRSDVNMLLIVNPKINHVEMISFPRDSYVPNPALGNISDKLTHTGNDGVENTMNAIEQVVGFDINFFVKVNFTSVVEMVDALGGVTVDVPVAFCEQNSERSFAEEDLQCLEVGEQHVDGEEALAFARHRKSEGVGDIGRTHAQQKVIMAMIQKVLTPSGATKVPELLDIIPKYVVTNISNEQLNNFISYELENMAPWTTSSMTLENGYNATLITASMGSTPLSCYVLSRSDLETVWQKYYIMNNPVSFKDFTFNLNDLNPSGIPKYTPSSNLVLYGDDLSAYLGSDTSDDGDTTPVEDEPNDNTETLPPVDEEPQPGTDTDGENNSGSGDGSNPDPNPDTGTDVVPPTPDGGDSTTTPVNQ